MIRDNNHLSVALASVLPLIVYLYRMSANRWARLGSAVVAISIVVTVVGTYSRGGFLALAAMGAIMALRSRAKLSIVFFSIVAAVVVFQVVPDKWLERMGTIGATEVDASVQGRYQAWNTAWNVAIQRPLGGGFNFGERQAIWDQYSGLPQGTPYHAAHNMYYQVLGEHGFTGLALFILMLFSALRNTQVTMRAVRKSEEGRPQLELANALQLSILGIMIGSISLSLAYYDMFLCFYGMTYALMRMVEHTSEKEAASGSRSPIGLTTQSVQ
jgi:probable O-glycosylation ligase (exosortase A-associated)